MSQIRRLLDSQRPSRVGIVGQPPRAIIGELNARAIEILDLDAMLVQADMESTVAILPRVYCAILRTVVLNAMHLDLEAIIIDTGPGKCDSALYVATILQEKLAIPVLTTVNLDDEPSGYPYCRSKLELTEKLLAITEGVKSAQPAPNPPPPCQPRAGFWGVPPRDFAILAHFPATTHVYGWSRCLENKTPAHLALEMHINPAIPTVFFAQSFCAKTALARHLAGRHPKALYLDLDLHTTSSARAKIQAFLELSGATL
ncbi:MAG: hypothetical protein HGA96_03205 [Desulfobulbaceae bacterium]|nr:hypothetical protein [Desulfobulbaceae bacterium]